MKKENTAIRLKKIMKENNLRQIDILKKALPFCSQYGIKLGRNDLSQYISGKVEPSQRKLTLLAKALNVNETWLMGYDVPMDYNETNDVVNNYKLGNEISKIFNQISSDLNIPIEELKEVFFNDSNNSNKELNYENLLSFFKEYFKKKIKK